MSSATRPALLCLLLLVGCGAGRAAPPQPADASAAPAAAVSGASAASVSAASASAASASPAVVPAAVVPAAVVPDATVRPAPAVVLGATRVSPSRVGATASQPAAPATHGPSLNAAILAAIATEYPWATPHPYVWSRGVNTDGVTQELLWRGAVLASPEADGGIHCSGITYEVFLRALRAAVGEEAGPSPETLLALKDAWYVRTTSDQGPVGALVDAGLGDRVDGLAGLKPGDIVQFWRNSGKGHSVVFISHTYNGDGSVRGMTYWSAQGTSGGVGQRRVSPGVDINQIADGRLYGVRARGVAR